MAQLGFLRKNVFRAFFIVALGLILVVVNALIFYRSDLLLQLPGLLVGILEISLGTRWLGKSLLVLSITGGDASTMLLKGPRTPYCFPPRGSKGSQERTHT